jgi:diketogulonate reductase-like aldo/keto reductase
VIPKTVTPSRITENLKATEIKLDAEDMKRLREVGNRNFRFLKVHNSNLVGLVPTEALHSPPLE